MQNTVYLLYSLYNDIRNTESILKFLEKSYLDDWEGNY